MVWFIDYILTIILQRFIDFSLFEVFSLPVNGFTRLKKRIKKIAFIPVNTSSTIFDQGEYKVMYKLWLQDHCWT